jgi:hypothetical protein
MNTDTVIERSVEDEQELKLWTVSRRYMRGEISIKDLEEVEHSHAAKLKKAIVTFAKQNAKRRLTRDLKRYTRYSASIVATCIGWFQ